LVDAILQQRIDFELHTLKFEDLDLTLDDALRQQALLQVFSGDLSIADRALAGFSEDYATAYIDDVTRQIAVQASLGNAEYQAWLSSAYIDTDIEVSPRYGRWDADQQSVVGPDGPTTPEPSEES
jgi:hypothetical protein